MIEPREMDLMQAQIGSLASEVSRIENKINKNNSDDLFTTILTLKNFEWQEIQTKSRGPVQYEATVEGDYYSQFYDGLYVTVLAHCENDTDGSWDEWYSAKVEVSNDFSYIEDPNGDMQFSFSNQENSNMIIISTLNSGIAEELKGVEIKRVSTPTYYAYTECVNNTNP